MSIPADCSGLMTTLADCGGLMSALAEHRGLMSPLAERGGLVDRHQIVLPHDKLSRNEVLRANMRWQQTHASYGN
jgi:hypothetical protein